MVLLSLYVRSLSRLERRAALDAHAALRLPLVVLVTTAARRHALVAPERHVRGVHRTFFFKDPAPRVALRRLGVALDHVDALDDHAILVGHEPQDAAALPLLLAGDDDDLVTLANVHDYRTSGASEMIFMKRLARSSRATGPKMRVPTGSLSLSTSTAELVSKRM